MAARDMVHFRFNGKAFDEHEIDISDLISGLVGLSELCQETNKIFNKNRSGVKILIKADVEQHCFELGFHLIRTAYEQIKMLLGQDEIATTKQILEWIGLLGIAGIGGPMTYLQTIKWLDGRKIKLVKNEKTENGRDQIQITVNGNNNNVTVISPQVFEMLKEPKLLDAAQRLVGNVANSPECDNIEFEYEGKITTKISKDDAVKIMKNQDRNLITNNNGDLEPLEPQIMTAYIKVYSPVYDAKAKKWRFQFGENVEYVDISDTSIGKDAIKRGGAMVDETYKVKLEMTQRMTDGGKISNEYKVIQVLDFYPAPKQRDMFLDE